MAWLFDFVSAAVPGAGNSTQGRPGLAQGPLQQLWIKATGKAGEKPALAPQGVRMKAENSLQD